MAIIAIRGGICCCLTVHGNPQNGAIAAIKVSLGGLFVKLMNQHFVSRMIANHSQAIQGLYHNTMFHYQFLLFGEIATISRTQYTEDCELKLARWFEPSTISMSDLRDSFGCLPILGGHLLLSDVLPTI